MAIVALLMLVPIVTAVDFDEPISPEDQATFDQMLQPVMKIYNVAKYSASAIGVLVLLFAGITYMMSGSDPKKRDTAKGMAMYVVLGMVVIWAAPLVVNFLIG